MSKQKRTKGFIYREYEEDLWGFMNLLKVKYSNKLRRLMIFSLLERDSREKSNLRHVFNVNDDIIKTRGIFSVDSTPPPRLHHWYTSSSRHIQLMRKWRRFCTPTTRRHLKLFIRRCLLLSGNSQIKFLILLESRLDLFLLRLNLFNSIYQLRQFLTHHGIEINNQKTHFGSFLLKHGDILKFTTKNQAKIFLFRLKKLSILFPIPIQIEYDFRLMGFLFYKPDKRISKINNSYYPLNFSSTMLHLLN